MDHAGRLGRGGADRDGPGPRLLRAGGQVGLQARACAKPTARQQIEPGLVLADRLQQLERPPPAGARPARPRSWRRGRPPRPARPARRASHAAPSSAELGVVDVEHVDERLGGQQVQLAQRLEVEAGRRRRVAPALSTLERLARPRRPWWRLPLASRTSFSSRGSAFSTRLQVGQDQLGVDRLDVVGRVDPAVDVGDVGVLEHPDHLADRVGLADVGQELVAQTLPLGGALDDAGDVDEGDRRGMILRRARQSRPSTSRRGSGTPTTPTFGSIVANG